MRNGLLKLASLVPVIILALNGIVYCTLAVLFSIDTVQWFSDLTIELQDPVGYTELRTTYVGLMLTLGVFSLLGAVSGTFRWPGLFLMAFSYLSLATVRAWGIFIEQSSNEFMLQLFTTEIICLLLALLAMWAQKTAQNA